MDWNCCGDLLSWHCDCKCRHANRPEVRDKDVTMFIFFKDLSSTDMSTLGDAATTQTTAVSYANSFTF